MKRWMKQGLAAALALTMVLSCCIGASAAEGTSNRVYDVTVSDGYELTLWDAADLQITEGVSEEADGAVRPVYKNVEKLKLSFAGTEGVQYVVFLLNGGSTVPVDGNIRYIDQLTGTAEMEITLYPDDLTEPGLYTVHLATSEYIQVASFVVAEELRYATGDVDGDGEITLVDAVKALRAAAKLDELNTAQFNAADVDGDRTVTADDARKILRVAAKLDVFE